MISFRTLSLPPRRNLLCAQLQSLGISPQNSLPDNPEQLLILWIYLFWIFLSGIIEYVAFYVWLLSFSIIFSRLSCVIACNSTSSLLWLNNIPLYKYTTSCLLIHQTDYFNFLTCTKNAAVNICVNFCVNIRFNFSCTYVYLGVELLGHNVTLFNCIIDHFKPF